MSWKLQSDRPIYSQLMELIELKICSGFYPPGSKIPSVRELAQEASVNPNTMQRALSTLESDGLLISNRTSGRFVTNDESEILKLKKKLAEKNVAKFLQMMSKLGFTKDEIQNAISKSYIWEDNNGNNT